ncbi:hypothetical protein Hamer_G010587 [Homarus americanus]|uniref:Uncharacterized protein n=1 Tax=Homarus americanus TaxID=6706 RepID=A0A8J5MJ98_HOMAM|nr:hypothetical protein Hamer_G010587 [Homarus americanus]
MKPRALLCLSWVVVVLSGGVEGLMFLPAPGDHCSDNIDCTSGCCLMTGHRHRRPIGVCQSLRQIDLTPCNFYLFLKIKSVFKGTNFLSVEEVKAKTTELLNSLTGHGLRNCFELWQHRMQLCVNPEGNYYTLMAIAVEFPNLRSVMEDPKCMPETMHPYILAMKGYGYNINNRHANTINIVPAE